MKTIRFAADYQDRHASNMLLFAADPSVKEVNAGGSGELDLSGLDDVVVELDPPPDLEADRREAMALLDELNLDDLDLGAPARKGPRSWKRNSYGHWIAQTRRALDTIEGKTFGFTARMPTPQTRETMQKGGGDRLKRRLAYQLAKVGFTSPRFVLVLELTHTGTGIEFKITGAFKAESWQVAKAKKAIRLSLGEWTKHSQFQVPDKDFHPEPDDGWWNRLAELAGDKSKPIFSAGLKAASRTEHNDLFGEKDDLFGES